MRLTIRELLKPIVDATARRHDLTFKRKKEDFAERMKGEVGLKFIRAVSRRGLAVKIILG